MDTARSSIPKVRAHGRTSHEHDPEPFVNPDANRHRSEVGELTHTGGWTSNWWGGVFTPAFIPLNHHVASVEGIRQATIGIGDSSCAAPSRRSLACAAMIGAAVDMNQHCARHTIIGEHMEKLRCWMLGWAFTHTRRGVREPHPSTGADGSTVKEEISSWRRHTWR